MLKIRPLTAAERLDHAADGNISKDTPASAVVLRLECEHMAGGPAHSLFAPPPLDAIRRAVEQYARENDLPVPDALPSQPLPPMHELRWRAVQNWWGQGVMTCGCDLAFWMTEGPEHGGADLARIAGCSRN